jgi:hypothetical protein
MLGKTIILSDIEVHKEQDPPNSLFFDPHIAETLAEQILTVFEADFGEHNLEQEAIARQNYLHLQLAYAGKFLQLAGL